MIIKIVLTILAFVPAVGFSQLYGKYDVGLINDSDGYVVVRSGQGTNTSEKDTIYENEFFQFLPNDSSDWFKVFRWGIEGYVHKSRIQNIKKLSRESQNNLLNEVFDMKKAYCEGSPENYNGKFATSEKYPRDTFNPSLDLFIFYMTYRYDDKLMRKFIDVLILNSGSADETPPTALGYVYLVRPDNVYELLREYGNYMINSMLDLGFANATFQRENEIENYDYLNNQISELFNKK